MSLVRRDNGKAEIAKTYLRLQQKRESGVWKVLPMKASEGILDFSSQSHHKRGMSFCDGNVWSWSKLQKSENVFGLTSEAKNSSEHLLPLVAITSWPIRKMNERNDSNLGDSSPPLCESWSALIKRGCTRVLSPVHLGAYRVGDNIHLAGRGNFCISNCVL